MTNFWREAECRFLWAESGKRPKGALRANRYMQQKLRQWSWRYHRIHYEFRYQYWRHASIALRMSSKPAFRRGFGRPH